MCSVCENKINKITFGVRVTQRIACSMTKKLDRLAGADGEYDDPLYSQQRWRMTDIAHARQSRSPLSIATS